MGLTSSKNATAEANGVIDDCVIDYIQAKINFNAAGEIVTKKGTVFASKIELDDVYGMRKASGIGKEWFEQAAGFSAWVTGKTFADELAMGVNESGYSTEADVITSCTMNVNNMLVVLRKAQSVPLHPSGGARAAPLFSYIKNWWWCKQHFSQHVWRIVKRNAVRRLTKALPLF